MNRRPLLIALAVIAVVIGACGSAASSAPTTDRSTSSDKLLFDAAGSAPGPAATTGPAGDPNAPIADAAMIVRTGSLSLIVNNVPAAVDAARTAIEGLGGHISASQSYGDENKPSAEVTYRIPVARFDDALAAIRALSLRVLTEQTQSTEVTGQVVDLAARLDNLRTTEKALQAIMAQATKIPDVLAVQSQLSDVRGQIEQLTAQQTQLADQVALSTLTVDFGIDVPATQATVNGWNPGQAIDSAVSQLIALGQGVATIGIEAVIVGLPVALLLGLLGTLAFGLLRVTRRLRPRTSAPETPPAA